MKKRNFMYRCICMLFTIGILWNVSGCGEREIAKKPNMEVDNGTAWLLNAPIKCHLLAIHKNGTMTSSNSVNCVLESMDDVPWLYPRYCYEWEIDLSTVDNIPANIRETLDTIAQDDVDKLISEILNMKNEPMAICAIKNKIKISKEPLPIFLKKLSKDRLILTVRSSPFLLSNSEDSRGLCEDVVVLYLPFGSKPSYCKNL